MFPAWWCFWGSQKPCSESFGFLAEPSRGPEVRNLVQLVALTWLSSPCSPALALPGARHLAWLEYLPGMRQAHFGFWPEGSSPGSRAQYPVCGLFGSHDSSPLLLFGQFYCCVDTQFAGCVRPLLCCYKEILEMGNL